MGFLDCGIYETHNATEHNAFMGANKNRFEQANRNIDKAPSKQKLLMIMITPWHHQNIIASYLI